MDISDQNKDFEHLFRLHYQRLCSYAYSIIKNEGSSEDIVQEVFIRIWEKQKMEIGTDKLRFYLFAAVRNNCLTWLQKNKKSIIQELNDEDGSDEIKIQIEQDVTETDPKMLIAKAMEQLPPKCREVFVLSRISGQKYQQIADTLGISVKTVENQMGKAIKVLKAFARENKIYPLLYLFFIW